MTYLITDQEHAQILHALKAGIRVMNHHNIPLETAPLHDALAMLKAMGPVSQKPLTDEQIFEAFCEAPHPSHFAASFKAGARFAEQAHGVKP